MDQPTARQADAQAVGIARQSSTNTTEQLSAEALRMSSRSGNYVVTRGHDPKTHDGSHKVALSTAAIILPKTFAEAPEMQYSAVRNFLNSDANLRAKSRDGNRINDRNGEEVVNQVARQWVNNEAILPLDITSGTKVLFAAKVQQMENLVKTQGRAATGETEQQVCKTVTQLTVMCRSALHEYETRPRVCHSDPEKLDLRYSVNRKNMQDEKARRAAEAERKKAEHQEAKETRKQKELAAEAHEQRERERKHAEWEREKERKHAEWEQRQVEKARKKAEYEQRQREKARKHAEWEQRQEENAKWKKQRQVEKERKQAEREQKRLEEKARAKAEWEQYKVEKERQKQRERRERERKQAEWEREKERKHAEWEQRQVEKARKKAEYEQRQREKARKKEEWEERKAAKERKQVSWQPLFAHSAASSYSAGRTVHKSSSARISLGSFGTGGSSIPTRSVCTAQSVCKKDGSPDMRFSCHRTPGLNKDGSKDMRYKMNRM